MRLEKNTAAVRAGGFEFVSLKWVKVSVNKYVSGPFRIVRFPLAKAPKNWVALIESAPGTQTFMRLCGDRASFKSRAQAVKVCEDHARHALLLGPRPVQVVPIARFLETYERPGVL